MSHRNPKPQIEAGEPLALTSVLHDCLSAGVIILDARGQVLCCSPEAGKLLHLPTEGVAGCDLTALPVPLQKLVREVVDSGRTVGPRSVALAAEQSAPQFRIGGHPFRSADGALQVVLTLHNDALVDRLEQNLNRLDRLAGIGTLAAGMAHEIKNAFVAVKTFVDLLLEQNPDAEFGDVVRRELRRIDAILSQMLRFRTPARPAFASVRIHDVLDHSLRLLQHQLDAKLITLHRTFSARRDEVLGDEYQLEQAFVNLFFNALDATGPNGTLTVRTELIATAPATPARPQLCVTIADNGIGIPPENLSRLFEPFFTTKQNGTGLGMAITRRIIREHHGDIRAESKVNHGTTFRVLLPAHGDK